MAQKYWLGIFLKKILYDPSRIGCLSAKISIDPTNTEVDMINKMKAEGKNICGLTSNNRVVESFMGENGNLYPAPKKYLNNISYYF